MKHLPHNTLPFKADFFDESDDDSMFIMDNEGEVIADIDYASDAEYITDACNNYQEVISLLEDILDQYNLDGDEYSDGEILDIIKPMIYGFLNKINNEKSS